MYVDPNVKAEDNRSTAWSFTIVGGIGFIFLILLELDILPIHIYGSQKILIEVVMGIMFLTFFSIGIRSFLSVKKLNAQAQNETSLEKEITDWFLENYTEYMISYTDEDMDESNPETYFYPRNDKICELIHNQYPSISDEFKEHIAEQLYITIFPD